VRASLVRQECPATTVKAKESGSETRIGQSARDGTRVRADESRCKLCKGAAVMKKSKRIEFHIQPGTKDGERITFKGQGDEAVRTYMSSGSWR
jgi:DnaJ-class molecular chaperone